MKTLNEQNFDIYDLDSINTIIDRIAYDLRTIPSFLYFEPDNIIDINIDNLTVINIIDKIKEYNDFLDLYRYIKSKLNILKNDEACKKNGLDILFIFKIWIQHQQQSWSSLGEDFIKIICVSIEDSIKNIPLLNNIDVNDMRLDTIDLNFSDFFAIIKNQIENFKYFQNINPIKTSEFEINKTTFELKIPSNNLSILEIFNITRVNEMCPLIVIKDFYKIYKEFIIIPPDDKKNNENWLENYIYSSDNIINIKLLQTRVLNKKRNYTDVNIRIEDAFILIQFDYKHSIYNINKEDLISTLFTIFINNNILKQENIINMNDIKINGLFYINNIIFNKYIFADMIMNDIIFSSLMSTDEHENASAIFNNVYVHFIHAFIGEITVNITGKVITIYDTNMKKKKDFHIGSKYIRIKIKKSDSLDKIEKFKNIISKIITIYTEKFQSIYNIYREYTLLEEDTIVLEIDKKIKISKSKILSDLVPDLFIPNYQRKLCADIDKLYIISEEESITYEKNKIMKFPREDTIVKFPNSDASQRYYTCSDGLFPGVKPNNLEQNKDIYPYVPCCFKKDQIIENKKKSNYRDYFIGKTENHETISKTIITSNKFVTNNFAILPQNIRTLFELSNNNEQSILDYDFLRKGFEDDKNSFIRCILSSLNLEENDENYSDMVKARNGDNLDDIRKSFVSMSILCKQELFNYTEKEIKEMILDINESFNPLFFIRILEVKYKCNIFIFYRKENSEAELVLPNHNQFYIKENNNYNNTFFVYYHNGSESDTSQYLRCELIVKKSKIDSIPCISIFNKNDNVSKGINKIYNSLNKLYNKKFNEYILPDLVYKSQKIDSNGKTRILQVGFEKNDIYIITRPIQPLNVIENKKKQIPKTSLPILIKFLEHYNFIIISKTIIENFITEITFIVNKGRGDQYHNSYWVVQITNQTPDIPIINKKDNSVVKSQNYITYPDTYKKSFLEEYDMFKKLAGYIVEYTLWLFSKYIHDNHLFITKNNIEIFIDTYIEVDTYFIYKDNVPKIFSITEDNGIIRNGKIIANTLLIKKKLKYSLNFHIIRYNKIVIDYHLRQLIENYYINVSDFNKNAYQIILTGKDSLELWMKCNNINNNKLKYVIYDFITTNIDIPDKKITTFFFKNNNILIGKLFIAQYSSSIQTAMNISYVWNNYGYNIGQSEHRLHPSNDLILETSVKFYIYNDKNNITTLNNEIISPYIIMEYTINDITCYFSLLDI